MKSHNVKIHGIHITLLTLMIKINKIASICFPAFTGNVMKVIIRIKFKSAKNQKHLIQLYHYPERESSGTTTPI